MSMDLPPPNQVVAVQPAEQLVEANVDAIEQNDVYQTIIVESDGIKHQVGLTFKQYMNLPEIHEGGSISDKDLVLKLQKLGILEEPVDSKGNTSSVRQAGQQEVYENSKATPMNDLEIKERQRLLEKFEKKGRNRGRKGKR